MTEEDLDRVERLDCAATRGPWFVEELNDDLGMSAIVVASGQLARTRRSYGEWHEDELVAGCLIQSSGPISSRDQRWHENAELIAAMRNVLPDLLRLARESLAPMSSFSSQRRVAAPSKPGELPPDAR